MPGSESVVAGRAVGRKHLSELIGRFGAELLAKPTMPVSGRNFPCW